MRKSTKLLGAGLVVGCLALTDGSAFTAANDATALTGKNLAGYSSTTVTGATVTNILYTLDTDTTKVAQIEFDVNALPVDSAAELNLTNGGSLVQGETCTVNVARTHITCALSPVVAVNAFDETGLTVFDAA